MGHLFTILCAVYEKVTKGTVEKLVPRLYAMYEKVTNVTVVILVYYAL